MMEARGLRTSTVPTQSFIFSHSLCGEPAHNYMQPNFHIRSYEPFPCIILSPSSSPKPWPPFFEVRGKQGSSSSTEGILNFKAENSTNNVSIEGNNENGSAAIACQMTLHTKSHPACCRLANSGAVGLPHSSNWLLAKRQTANVGLTCVFSGSNFCFSTRARARRFFPNAASPRYCCPSRFAPSSLFLFSLSKDVRASTVSSTPSFSVPTTDTILCKGD